MMMRTRVGRWIGVAFALVTGVLIGLIVDASAGAARSAVVSRAAGAISQDQAAGTGGQRVAEHAASIPLPVAGSREEGAQNRPLRTQQSREPEPVIPGAQAGPPMSFREVAAEVLPTVVEINTVEVVRRSTPRFRSPFDFFFGPGPGAEEQEFRRPGLGSGVIVRQDGRDVYVLTNDHVVGDATEISVRLSDGREFEADLVGKDARTDLALVAFTTREDVPMARLGDSDSLYVGDWVLAIGNPLGFESTVTAGIVSALGREPQPGSPIAGFTDYIQTDASINPGNSGGALVNLNGEVVGINTWIASRSGGSVGLGFAIPANNARRAVDEFISEGRIVYGWLGVSIEDATDARLPGVASSLGVEGRDGTLVLNVHRGSPAARAGMRPGDYIVSVDGQPVADSQALTRIVGNLPPGRRTEFRVVRQGAEQTLSVRLEQRGTEEEVEGAGQLWPGVAAVALTDDMRERGEFAGEVDGVVAAAVVSDSPAARAGLRRGDIITMVNGVAVDSVAGFYAALNEDEGTVALRVYRDGTLIGLRMPGL
ncbi:MAG: Do family serine endopeptidase [Spirochaetes bacterium]|jgi:serine protease Do|nr:Do family serine endopeptidase [Spirochaetota bacterium]